MSFPPFFSSSFNVPQNLWFAPVSSTHTPGPHIYPLPCSVPLPHPVRSSRQVWARICAKPTCVWDLPFLTRRKKTKLLHTICVVWYDHDRKVNHNLTHGNGQIRTTAHRFACCAPRFTGGPIQICCGCDISSDNWYQSWLSTNACNHTIFLHWAADLYLCKHSCHALANHRRP